MSPSIPGSLHSRLALEWDKFPLFCQPGNPVRAWNRITHHIIPGSLIIIINILDVFVKVSVTMNSWKALLRLLRSSRRAECLMKSYHSGLGLEASPRFKRLVDN